MILEAFHLCSLLDQKQEHTNLSASTSEWEMWLETSQAQIILKAMLFCLLYKS